MIRHIALLTNLAVFSLLIISSGCGQQDESKGLRINIHGQSRTDLFHTLTTPTTTSELNCIAVNINGGTIPETSSCNGTIYKGVLTDTVSSLPATLTATIPMGSNTMFTVYGYKANSCVPLSNAFDTGITNDSIFDGHIYNIGQTISNITDDTIISISTSFNALNFKSCNMGGSSGVSGGSNFACAYGSNGVYCWGQGNSGQLGNNSTSTSTIPTQVTGVGGSGTLTGLNSLSVGSAHACALLSGGTAVCWGTGTYGQLGDGTTSMRSYPVAVLGNGATGILSNITSIASGGSHTCASTSGGNVYCWGYGLYGQLGNNSTSNQSSPVQVFGLGGTGYLSGISSVTAGQYHTCALNNAGNVYCWGMGTSGQVGNNNSAQYIYPVAVLSTSGSGNLSSISNIASSSVASHTCAVTTSGEPLCWGLGSGGQIGSNSTSNAMYPVTVYGTSGTGTLSSIASISAGTSHTCAKTTSGNAYCWGTGTSGELGQGSFSSLYYPVNVSGVAATNTISTITAYSSDSCISTTTGSVYCWGNSASGALGTNTSNVSTPTQVLSTSGTGYLQLFN